MMNVTPNTPEAQAARRPRLWQFKSGLHFEPGWTDNELIDARHERNLRLDGCYPAIDVRVAA